MNDADSSFDEDLAQFCNKYVPKAAVQTGASQRNCVRSESCHPKFHSGVKPMSARKVKTENCSDRSPMSQKDVEAAVRQTMLKQHIDVNETFNCNGKLHYYHAEGDKRGTKKVWLVVHLGKNPRAHFGHFRNDNRGHWYANGASTIPDDELNAIYRQLTKDRKRREKAERKAAALALARAVDDWSHAKKDVSGHPYVRAKQVKPLRMRRLKHRLLAILHGIDGKPRGVPPTIGAF